MSGRRQPFIESRLIQRTPSVGNASRGTRADPRPMRHVSYAQDPEMPNERESNLRSGSPPGFRHVQTNCALVDVERADLSDEDLRTAIRAGRLLFPMVETSTPVGEKRLRRGRAELRTLTLENYRFSCALRDVANPDLLIASHVIGWSTSAETRGDLRNTTCLCRLHDALFDTGYWSLTDDLPVIRRTGIDSRTGATGSSTRLTARTGS